MNAKKWRRHWNILKRFSPGYDPQAGVVETTTDWPLGTATPEEAYWRYQERGERMPCADPAKVRELLQRKAGMDLTVGMWKDTIRECQRGTTAYEKWAVPQSMVVELAGEFPVSFLDGIGLCAMVGMTIKQIGMRLGKIRELMPEVTA